MNLHVQKCSRRNNNREEVCICETYAALIDTASNERSFFCYIKQLVVVNSE